MQTVATETGPRGDGDNSNFGAYKSARGDIDHAAPVLDALLMNRLDEKIFGGDQRR